MESVKLTNLGKCRNEFESELFVKNKLDEDEKECKYKVHKQI
jgi:hypothetical protein